MNNNYSNKNCQFIEIERNHIHNNLLLDFLDKFITL